MDQFSTIERMFISFGLLCLKFALCLSLAGCGAAALSSSASGLATAIVLVADADVSLTKPELPDSLGKPDVGAAPTSAKLPQVQLFVTDGCPPCREAKRWLESQKRIPWVVMPENPDWTRDKGFPSLAWETPKGWSYWHGWRRGDEFERFYQESLK